MYTPRALFSRLFLKISLFVLSVYTRVGFLPAETCFCRTCGLNQFKPEKKPGSWYHTDMNSPEMIGMSYSLTQVDILSLDGSLLYSSVCGSLYK